MRIAIIYFSGTNVTKEYAKLLETYLHQSGNEVELMDITPYKSREKIIDYAKFNLVIFGFPVYADFPPEVVNEWLLLQKGKGTQCVTFFTYGGRTTGVSHYYAKVQLEGNGFQVLCSAEFLGRHSFNVGGWKMMMNRPNAEDYETVKKFADVSIELLEGKKTEHFELQKPYGYDFLVKQLNAPKLITKRHDFHPYKEKACSQCGICEVSCANNAFDSATGEVDLNRCILCMKCVYNCKEKALRIGDQVKEVYYDFLIEWNLCKLVLNSKKSKILLLPSDANQ